MPITLAELDGKYKVRSKGLEEGMPYTVDGDGETEIRNGLTFRTDRNGLVWESAFSIIGPAQVQMESTVDPGQKAETALLRDAKGNFTTDIVTFKTILDATRENGKLVLSGIIEHGVERTRLTMAKI